MGGVRRIADFIGVDASDEVVAKVSQAVVFDTMKERLLGQKIPKLRKGVAGGWRDELSGDLLAHFDEVHNRNMEQLDMLFEFDFGDEPETSSARSRQRAASSAAKCWEAVGGCWRVLF